MRRVVTHTGEQSGVRGSKLLGGNVRFRVGEKSDLIGFLLKSVRDCGFVQSKDCPDTVGPEDRLSEMYSDIGCFK